MKLIFSIITTLTYFFSVGQHFSVSADKNNVLYIGVDNPLTITTEKIPCNQIVVSTDKGQINGIGCTYIYRDFDPGFVNIKLSKKEDGKLSEIGQRGFRVKNIPNPIPKIGPSSGGDIQKVVLINQKFLRAELDFFDYDVKFNVDSFTICIIRNDTCLYKEISNVGSKLNDKVIAALKEIKKGDFIIFKKIFAKGPDAIERLISPLVLTISE